ncbi:MAG: hypothetical protein P1V97_14275 [Planctomycetota bacterium]|nr:hypothetical protein [Planctomycetota bacterium]
MTIGCTQIPDRGDVRADGIDKYLGRDPGGAMAGGLGVAPVTIAEGARLKLENEVDPTETVDTDMFQAEIVAWANKTSLFKQCTLLKKEEEGQSFDDVAWATGSDVILETTITAIRPRFKDHHWSWIPNWVNLVMLTIPAWWVATENYELEVEVELRLRLLDQAQSQLVTTAKTVVEGRFDEWERGFRWLGLGMVFSPGMNTADNWTKISKKLFPAAAGKLSQQMVQTLESEFRPVTKEKSYDKAKKRTLAIVVGIGSYKDSNNFQPNPEATKGAKEVAKELTAKYGKRYVKTLFDSQATRKRLEETVDTFLRNKARAGDNIILYISTRTVMFGGSPVAVMYDSTTDKGLMPVGIFGSILEGIPGDKALMIETNYPAKTKKDLNVLFKPLFNKKITVMSATRPGSDQATTGFGMGLFSYHMANGLKGKGDLNRDGQIDFDEVGVYVDEKVQSDSGLRGDLQKPFVVIQN